MKYAYPMYKDMELNANRRYNKVNSMSLLLAKAVATNILLVRVKCITQKLLVLEIIDMLVDMKSKNPYQRLH